MRKFSQFYRKCLAASVLMLILAYSTFAGDIQYPGVTATPPVTTDGEMQFPTVASSSETADGEMPLPGVAVDSVTGMAVTLWQSAMALF
jgi:hypothetical protein